MEDDKKSIIEATLKYLSGFKLKSIDSSGSITRAISNIDETSAAVLSRLKYEDIYYINAKRAFTILDNIWKIISGRIYDNMNSELSNMEDEIKTDILRIINNFKPEQYVENEIIIKKRNQLISIENISDRIRKQIL